MKSKIKNKKNITHISTPKFNIPPIIYCISPSLQDYKKSFIYGEVHPPDIASSIQEKFHLSSFLDIGCGRGELLFYMYKQFPDILLDGIEIDPDRTNVAICEASFHEYNDRINISTCDFRSIYLGNFDFIYCCNTVFTKNDNNDLYKKILGEFTGICILFEYDKLLRPYLISSNTVRTSWSNCVPIFFFQI